MVPPQHYCAASSSTWFSAARVCAGLASRLCCAMALCTMRPGLQRLSSSILKMRFVAQLVPYSSHAISAHSMAAAHHRRAGVHTCAFVRFSTCQRCPGLLWCETSPHAGMSNMLFCAGASVSVSLADPAGQTQCEHTSSSLPARGPQ